MHAEKNLIMVNSCERLVFVSALEDAKRAQIATNMVECAVDLNSKRQNAHVNQMFTRSFFHVAARRSGSDMDEDESRESEGRTPESTPTSQPATPQRPFNPRSNVSRNTPSDDTLDSLLNAEVFTPSQHRLIDASCRRNAIAARASLTRTTQLGLTLEQALNSADEAVQYRLVDGIHIDHRSKCFNDYAAAVDPKAVLRACAACGIRCYATAAFPFRQASVNDAMIEKLRYSAVQMSDFLVKSPQYMLPKEFIHVWISPISSSSGADRVPSTTY